mmetsp:Transcript_21452/g.37800  ORF Transcript_21452/g.37800 Transcript_21452/m.37800 type:complete len:208 (-) Transcript_21452:13-636(-)
MFPSAFVGMRSTPSTVFTITLFIITTLSNSGACMTWMLYTCSLAECPKKPPVLPSGSLSRIFTILSSGPMFSSSLTSVLMAFKGLKSTFTPSTSSTGQNIRSYLARSSMMLMVKDLIVGSCTATVRSVASAVNSGVIVPSLVDRPRSFTQYLSDPGRAGPNSIPPSARARPSSSVLARSARMLLRAAPLICGAMETFCDPLLAAHTS